MSTALGVALVTAIGALAASVFSVFSAKWREQKALARLRKIEHYDRLVQAISAVCTGEQDAFQKLALAYNTILLVAPQPVLKSLHDLITGEPIPIDSPQLKALILAIRSDIGVKPTDDPKNFTVKLLGAS